MKRHAFLIFALVLAYSLQAQIIIMQDPVSARTFNGDKYSGMKGQFVQVLAEGKISFYRSDIKLISEMSEINSGMIKTFITATRYFIIKDGQTALIRLNKNEVFELMKDNEAKVKSFIEEHKIPVKKEADFTRILQFYNSL
jgi:hypothetical protein